MTVVGSQVPVHCHDATSGYEPWVSDGTAAGTRLVADLAPGDSSSPENFRAAGSRRAFFQAMSNGRRVLYTTDGSAAGTQIVHQAARRTRRPPRSCPAAGSCSRAMTAWSVPSCGGSTSAPAARPSGSAAARACALPNARSHRSGARPDHAGARRQLGGGARSACCSTAVASRAPAGRGGVLLPPGSGAVLLPAGVRAGAAVVVHRHSLPADPSLSGGTLTMQGYVFPTGGRWTRPARRGAAAHGQLTAARHASTPATQATMHVSGGPPIMARRATRDRSTRRSGARPL